MQARQAVVATALAAIAASAWQTAVAQPGGGDLEPVRWTLAVADPAGRQSEQAALDLAAALAELSEGRFTIEPVFGAGDLTDEGFEHGVAELVKAGDHELAMTSTRAWDLAGVTSLQAFQAPFLIDHDALARAVAESEIADRALAAMGGGVTGLAMWPEDLRHLFWFTPSGREIRAPEDLTGASILTIPSAASRALTTTLGATPYQEGLADGPRTGDKDVDAQAGTLTAFETGLTATGLPFAPASVAGDLVLFPKYQALFANRGALEDLSPSHREVLEEAVRRMERAAFGRQPSEVDLAAALCAEGVSVITLGEDAVQQFREAARPLREAMERDPLTSELIAAIEALGASVGRSPAAPPCDDRSTQASYPVSDTTGSLGSVPPNGVYRADVPAADLIALGVDPTWARDNGGLMTWTFEDGIVTQRPAGGAPCQGDYASVEGQYVAIVTRPGQPCGLELAFRWRPESDGISFVLMPPVDSVWPLDDFLQVQAHLERRVWTRIAEAPSSDATGTLPPLGTFRAEITAEDLERRGAGHVDAVQDAGVVTMTFHGDRAVLQWDLPLDGRCEPSYGIVGDVVRFVFTGADGCEPGTYDLTFTVDGDVLRPVVVATEPPDELDATRAFFERDWLSID